MSLKPLLWTPEAVVSQKPRDLTQAVLWVACQWQDLLGSAQGEGGASSRGGSADAINGDFVFRSRRDLEIERPMPGVHTVTLQ